MPGSTVISSASTSSRPFQLNSEARYRWIVPQYRSMLKNTSGSWPQRFSAICFGSAPSGTSNESPRLWAMSVEMASVRRPRSAHRIAVAAATLVLPTPPLPV